MKKTGLAAAGGTGYKQVSAGSAGPGLGAGNAGKLPMISSGKTFAGSVEGAPTMFVNEKMKESNSAGTTKGKRGTFLASAGGVGYQQVSAGTV